MLFFVLAVVQFYRLHTFDSPTGADGFFYLKQIQSISEQGFFYYKDYSIAFVFPTLLNYIIKNPLISYLSSCCFTYAGIAFFLYKLYKIWPQKNTKHQWVLQSLLAIFLFTNNFYFELNFTYHKTAWALFYFLIALNMREKTIWSVFFFMLALMSHKIMLVWLSIYICLFHWNDFFSFLKYRKQRSVLYFLAALAFSVSICFLIFPNLFAQLKHQLAHFTFGKFLMIEIKNNLESSIAAAFCGVVGLMVFLLKPSRVSLGVGIIAIIPLFYPDSLGTNGASYRFLLITLPIVLFAMLFVFFYEVQNKKRSHFLLGSGFIIAGLINWHLHWLRPIESWINPWQKRASEALGLEKALPKDALLYAPHGMEFYLAYVTSFRPRSLILPQSDPLTLKPTYRVAFVGPYIKQDSALKDDIEQLSVFKLSENYRVFKFEDWENLNLIHQFVPHPSNILLPKPDFIAGYIN